MDNGITRRSFLAAAAGVLGMAAANVRPGEQVRLEAEEVRLKADTTPVYRIGRETSCFHDPDLDLRIRQDHGLPVHHGRAETRSLAAPGSAGGGVWE